MKTCIYIVTFPRDYQLLQWGVRSLRRYLAGEYKIHVIIPVGAPRPTVDADHIATMPEPPGKGFLAHMIVNCQPDLYAPGFDRYMHWDSDCMITRPSHLHDFGGERPIVYYAPYKDLIPNNQTMALWQVAVKHCLGFTPEHEFMRTFPISYPAHVYPSTRKRVALVTRKPFDEYVFSCRNEFPQTFGEFNTLGAWAWLEHRKDVDFQLWGGPRGWWGDRLFQFWGPGGPDFRSSPLHGDPSTRGKTPREAARDLGLL